MRGDHEADDIGHDALLGRQHLIEPEQGSTQVDGSS
jgi:hypothetical protein